MKDHLYQLLNWAELNNAHGTAEAARSLLFSEAGNSTKSHAPVSGDLFAPPMPAMPPASETQPNGQEMHVYAAGIGTGRSRAFCDDAWTGYSAENWLWPEMPGDPVESPNANAEPLLSKANLRDIEPDSFIQNLRLQSEAWRKQAHHEAASQMIGTMLGIHMAMETAKMGCLLNPNITEDGLRRIFGAPPKHRFILLSGAERKERAAQ